ncbi:serine/threonine protein kinase [Glycomyces arizonensis]|uniref:serine/threonine protein kinase n=1 Tax=Glycomyces arizonensis TaxID=256035 RepID=UPI000406CDD9|nr:protein kinase [Glycomyces arizonensis]
MTNATVDLVCGPADPLPGSEQSYRLTGMLGSGGQADVYQAVRMSAGISSTPLTVKVFRLNPGEERERQYRSWDKGDAVLMDLHSRNVGSICRRIDAFYGRMPHHPSQPATGEPVPFQVLEYLPGHDLRQLLAQRIGRVDASRTLQSVVNVMLAMHSPPQGAHPVLHMDLKPANVIIGPDGSAKVIDFTGARYHTPAHLTTIAYTRETAGPEAHEGRVGPAYDVHGFGSIAFYLVTGASARTDSPGETQSVPWARLRRHPVLESNPRLRELLTAPLDDNPDNRPRTDELSRWITELATVVGQSNVPDLGVDWGRSNGEGPGATAATRILGGRISAPTMPVATPAPSPSAAAGGTRVMESGMDFADGRAPDRPVADRGADKPIAGRVRVPEQGSGDYVRGRAGHSGRNGDGQLPRLRLAGDPPEEHDGDRHRRRLDRDEHDRDEPQQPLLGPPGSLSKGLELSIIGGLFSLIMWLMWTVQEGMDNLGDQAIGYLLVLGVAVGLFFLIRVLGGMFWGRMLGVKRRTARLTHLLTGAFLFVVGLSYLNQLTWDWLDFDFSPFEWFTDWFNGLFE